MSNSDTLNAQRQLKTIYVLIHLILLIPVLLLPVPMLIFQNPMLNDLMLPKWSLSIALLFVASVIMDSFLHHLKQHEKVMSAVLWVSLSCLLTLKNHDNTWVLALAIFIHSSRSGFPLFKSINSKKWLWFAWARDIVTPIIVLLWLYLLRLI